MGFPFLLRSIKSMPIASLSFTAAPARARKGEATRAAIVGVAMGIARRDGLEGLTIGAVAEAAGMSKSGVFAHFGSREDLQLAVLRAYAEGFVGEVLAPALRAPRGLPRLMAVLDNWLALLTREIEQGCLMISGASEYDDRPGPLRDAMVTIVTGWNAELLRAIDLAKGEGHLRAEADSEQLAFEIYGLVLAMHQEARLLRSAESPARARRALDRLMADVRVANLTTISPSPRRPAARKKAAGTTTSRS